MDAPAKSKGEFSWAAIGLTLVTLVVCMVSDGCRLIQPPQQTKDLP